MKKTIDPFFTESFEMNYVMMSFEFLLATRVYRDTINLFRVRLMVICKEIQLITMVSIHRYKRKPLYDTLFWESSGPRKFGASRCKIEGGISI